jgi:N-acetylneuraminic acid mutarotase
MPTPRLDATTWCSDGALWLFSGQRSIDFEAELDDMWRFDLATQSWSIVPGAPPGRSDPAVWIESATLFMYGGAIRNSPLNELWCFDTETYEWSANIRSHPGQITPGPRSGSAAWYDGENRAWLFGGIGQSSAGSMEIRNDLWSYSSQTDSWREEIAASSHSSGMPRPRTHASMSVTEKTVWIFGGLGRSERGVPFSDLWSFEKRNGEATRRWDSSANSASYPSSRVSPALFADRAENVFLFGGLQNEPHRRHLNDLWRFETSTRQWLDVSGNRSTQSVVEPWPSPRSNCCTWIDEAGQLWLFGGYGTTPNGDPGMLGDLWLARKF